MQASIAKQSADWEKKTRTLIPQYMYNVYISTQANDLSHITQSDPTFWKHQK